MLNATNVGIGELRSTIEEAMRIRTSLHQRTILFLDEIHRFNKSQQDVLLPSVESGQIILIGATTENPFFEVNRPLLSRLRLLTLERLDATALVAILRRALTDEEYGLGKKALIVTDDLLEDIGRFVDGDALYGFKYSGASGGYGSIWWRNYRRNYRKSTRSTSVSV